MSYDSARTAGSSEDLDGTRKTAASGGDLETLDAPQGGGPWHRGVFANMTILGLCSFLGPGIWAAMSATGGGGQQSVSLVNAANSSTFSLMVVTGFLTPTFVRLTNLRIVLILGTLGYAPYAASLYTHGKYGTDWFVVFGAVLCGLSAGSFWASEGYIALSYPMRSQQGFYLSYWLMYRVLGQMLGGAINLGLNARRDKAGSLGNDTYIVFVVLQCLGPFVALLISLPGQVRRKDGTPVLLHLAPSIKQEALAMVRTLVRKRNLLLLPMIWQSTFCEALIFTFAGKNFTVRARALGSFLSAIVASLACYILGFYLDNRRLSINFRGRSAFAAVYAMQLGWWTFSIIIMNRYQRPHESLDWTSSGFQAPFALYMMLQIGYNLMYEFTYWVVGTSDDKPAEIVRLASIIRAVESAGQAVSYGINSTPLRLDAISGINMALCAISIPFSWTAIRRVGILEDGTYLYKPRLYADDEHERAAVAQKPDVAVTDAKGA